MNAFHSTAKITLFALGLSSLAGCSSGDQVALRFDPGQGSVHRNQVEMEASSTLRLFAEMGFQLNLKAILTQNATEKGKGGSTWVELGLSQVDLEFGVNQNIFSRDDLDIEMDERSRELVDRYEKERLLASYDRQGRVLEVRPLDVEMEIPSPQTADTLAGLQEDTAADAGMNLQRLLGDNFLERLASYQPDFPEDPIRIGGSWTTVTVQDVLGLPVTLTNTYTLKSREKGLATLSLSGTYSMDTARLEGRDVQLPFEGLSLPNAKQIRFLLKGAQKGDLIIEEEGGWTHSSKLEQQIQMQFELGALTIPVAVVNKISLSPEGTPE